MVKHPKRPRDPNQLAKMIVDLATGDAPPDRAADPVRSAAGSLGGAARAASLPANRRAEIAKAAAKARNR